MLKALNSAMTFCMFLIGNVCISAVKFFKDSGSQKAGNTCVFLKLQSRSQCSLERNVKLHGQKKAAY